MPTVEAIDDAAVILHLEIEVSEVNRPKLLEFCKRAFPVYESLGGCRMALYEDRDKTGSFDEVGYYQTAEDYTRSEKAIEDDPEQAALIKEWRSLLKGPPRVRIVSRRL